MKKQLYLLLFLILSYTTSQAHESGGPSITPLVEAFKQKLNRLNTSSLDKKYLVNINGAYITIRSAGMSVFPRISMDARIINFSLGHSGPYVNVEKLQIQALNQDERKKIASVIIDHLLLDRCISDTLNYGIVAISTPALDTETLKSAGFEQSVGTNYWLAPVKK